MKTVGLVPKMREPYSLLPRGVRAVNSQRLLYPGRTGATIHNGGFVRTDGAAPNTAGGEWYPPSVYQDAKSQRIDPPLGAGAIIPQVVSIHYCSHLRAETGLGSLIDGCVRYNGSLHSRRQSPRGRRHLRAAARGMALRPFGCSFDARSSRPYSDCERCSVERFTWLPCTCLWQCHRVLNCNGLRFKDGADDRRQTI
jgi:hypothetical protein